MSSKKQAFKEVDIAFKYFIDYKKWKKVKHKTTVWTWCDSTTQL